MGLDCYFAIKYDEKKSFDFDVKENIGYFRGYYSLSDYMYNLVHNAPEKYKYDEYSIMDWVLLSKSDIQTMMDYVNPIYSKLSDYTEEEVDEFDTNGYPEDFNSLFATNPFNPYNDNDRWGGYNIQLLYECLSKILALYDDKSKNPIVAFMKEC